MNKIEEMIKIADIHVARINSAIRHTKYLFPIDAKLLNILPEDNLVWIDLLINRFGKLQDIIGSKIIDLFLDSQQESINELTMLDKLHKLEKLGIIKDSEIWNQMRKVRNYVAHEYPDRPEFMAHYINQIFDLAPKLLEILDSIKDRIIKVK